MGEPNVITNNASISACEKGHQWAVALQILGSMRRCGLEPNVITNNASISACEKGHQWAVALQILGSMRRCGLESNVITVISGPWRCRSWAACGAAVWNRT